MKRLERLTALLSFLQSKRYTFISEIENKFGVSERTAYRDLRALEESGVPIYFEKEKGYSILDRHFLPPLAFTLEEAKSFIFVGQLARKYTDEKTFQHFSSALEKIKNKLKDNQLADIEFLEENVSAYINPAYTPKYLHLAEKACSGKLVLKMKYQDIKGDVTERFIEPIGITFYSQSWHLIAYCRMREDYRDFSILRIQDLQETGEQYTQRHLSLHGYIKMLQERDGY